jgi:hypothetical protein
MSIAAAYLVSEGVVLGADSSTTVSIKGGVVQLLDHSQKVFEVGENSRLGVCTWGAGNLGKTSHRTIVAQLADNVNLKTTVEEATNKLSELVAPIVDKENIPFVGYYLGGWDSESHEPSCFRIDFKPKEVTKEALKLGLCAFSGNASFFTRVFRGFDPLLKVNLKGELKNKLGNVPENFDTIFDEVFNRISIPLLTAGFQDLPIREAIDFVYSYLHITVKAEKFKFGAPTCGGPIEVGFVSSDRCFRWVRHKLFDSAITEQEGLYVK